MADENEKKVKKTPKEQATAKPKEKASAKAAKPATPKQVAAAIVKAKSAPKVKSTGATSTEPAAKPKKAATPKTPKKVAVNANTDVEAPSKEVKSARKAPEKSGEYVPRLKEQYNDKVIPYMIDKFGYSNPNMVPKLSKISINSRISTARDEVKDIEAIVGDITVVAGQKAVVTRAKKAVANFKIRQGDPVGATVTIRGRRMYEFLDRMVSIAIPRVRDFNGLRVKSFDGFGNYSWGVKEQIIFLEIDYDKVDKIRGMDITIVTTAKTDEEGYELLKSLGMPFRIHETAEQGS